MAEDNTTEPILYCYAPYALSASGIFRMAPMYEFSLPVLLWQMILVVMVGRALAFLLKPLHQIRVVAEILAGIVLGPSMLGKIELGIGEEGKPMTLGEALFPPASYRQMETMGFIGLLYLNVLIVAEFDGKKAETIQKKMVAAAAANFAAPFIITLLVAHAMKLQPPEHVNYLTHFVLLGVTMAVTEFMVLFRHLRDLKILNSEHGQLVLSSVVLSDMMAWGLLAITVALPVHSNSPNGEDPQVDVLLKFAPLWILLSGNAFALACRLVARPIMCWMVRSTPEGEPISDVHITITAVSVLAAGIITDAIGLHPVFGSLAFGLSIPQGPLSAALWDKLEVFVISVMTPMFFFSMGFKADLSLITVQNKDDARLIFTLVLIIALAFVAKLGASLFIARHYSMSASQGLSLGLHMNTKGLIDMIILSVAQDKRIFDERTHTILVLGSIFTTVVVPPAVAILRKSSRSRVAYKRRNLQRCQPNAELRMVACIHSTPNVHSIISLLQMSNPTKRSPIFVYALHLLELGGRTSANVVVHDTSKNRDKQKVPSSTSAEAVQLEKIITTLENYEQQAGGVSVQPVTVLSPYSTMHEDVFNIVEERHGTLIILPFHKLPSVAGHLEDINPAIRSVNQSVLANSPCSVGILVDRGLSGRGWLSVSHLVQHRVAVLFFGGPDDREALAYSSRLAEHPGVNLTVIRFIPGDDAMVPPSSSLSCKSGQQVVTTTIEEANLQRQLDDECVNQFRLRYVSEETVMYAEKVINNAEDTVAAIRAMNSIHSMYVVGRGQGMESSPLLVGLTEWSEYPELGPIGDMLVSADFGEKVSVLVLQQYVSGEAGNPTEVTAALECARLAMQQHWNCAVTKPQR